MSDYNPILSAPQGANKKPKRVGRGSSSGLGTTAGKGNKGQQSRSGGKVYVGFEGGQMPLYRRVAIRGFSNYPFKKEYVCINVSTLEKTFEDGATVDKESLKNKGFISKTNNTLVKVLGDGEITKKLTVVVDKVSASAKAKIEKAGGSVTVAEKAEEKK
ncbi:MAG: 50S ribosomal protein L15 [Treponema sp.]|jgi:large subunit ribosomal protein L15|nr:50S ribosomal protein L15 [Treponema sp.]